ncbi:MAG TPA: hypothetical protein VLD86_09410, partial [Ilumatobacteraceae bacterium]|nr:hypothetical protein [Ilumatobacteraceae bacterium]
VVGAIVVGTTVVDGRVVGATVVDGTVVGAIDDVVVDAGPVVDTVVVPDESPPLHPITVTDSSEAIANDQRPLHDWGLITS